MRARPPKARNACCEIQARSAPLVAVICEYDALPEIDRDVRQRAEIVQVLAQKSYPMHDGRPHDEAIEELVHSLLQES